MTTVSDAEAPPDEPPQAPSILEKLSSWYYGLNPTYRVTFRWVFIAALTGVAFHDSIFTLVAVTRGGSIGGYAWVVPLASVLVALGVARRHRTELPIHDRQTDIIVGSMGLILALLIYGVLLMRYEIYFYLLRLDLLTMWLFVLSASIVLFGLRPVARFAWVWLMLLAVFALPYHLLTIFLGGGKFAAGAATLVLAGLGTGIAVGRTKRRGAIGSAAAWMVGFAVLLTIWVVAPGAPMLLYQLVPALAAICIVGSVLFFQARWRTSKRLLDRKVEPLAAKQVWAGVPLVAGIAVALYLIPLPPEAHSSVVSRTAPGGLAVGQPMLTPPGWSTIGTEDYDWVDRFYGENAVLVRQQMVADVGDPRFDKYGRPRTVMVDSIVSVRPFSFETFPVRFFYDMTGARLSAPRFVDLGYGVTGRLASVVDDNLLVTWNSLRFYWGDREIGQSVAIFSVDNHEPDAPFPEPSGSLVSTLRTMFTLLFRGNAVLDERSPTFKDAEMLTEFGRALVAEQFGAAGSTG